MKSSIVRVGIVGGGEIAQSIHLPTLTLLSHLYKVTAVCDTSAQTVAHCQSKFAVAEGYQNPIDLIRSANVDLVLVAAPDEYHHVVAVQAIEAGKHVLIEKPIALTRRHAAMIVESARLKPELIVAVGYMRRYAAAMDKFKELVASAGKINYVVVRDIIGPNATFVAESGTYPVKATDFPAGALEEKTALGKSMVEEAIGTRAASDPALATIWRLLNGLASHDISALREIFGTPRRVNSPAFVTRAMRPDALFEYDGFNCHYETGIDTIAKFDAYIEVFADKSRLKLVYDTPYIKGLPVRISVSEHDSDGIFSEREMRVSYEDPYTHQFLSLHKSITTGAAVRTPPEDALQDLEIFGEIVAKLQESRE